MAIPVQPVTLSPEQVGELNRRLAEMRHNVNNALSMVTAAGEILLHKPELMQRMVHTLMEQPQRITNEIQQFSAEMEKTLGITRGT